MFPDLARRFGVTSSIKEIQQDKRSRIKLKRKLDNIRKEDKVNVYMYFIYGCPQE